MDRVNNEQHREPVDSTEAGRGCGREHGCKTSIRTTLGEPENRAIGILYLLATAFFAVGVLMMVMSLVDGAVQVLPRDPLTRLAVVHLGIYVNNIFGCYATFFPQKFTRVSLFGFSAIKADAFRVHCSLYTLKIGHSNGLEKDRHTTSIQTTASVPNTMDSANSSCCEMHYCKTLCARLDKFIRTTLEEPENRAIGILYLLSTAFLALGVLMMVVSVVDGAVQVLPRDPLTILAVTHLGVAFTFALIATRIRKLPTRNTDDDSKYKTEGKGEMETCPAEFEAEDHRDKKIN
ncbi:hypothetical protein ScPMuIL_004236 [Solemya velum]